ncbi:MAG: GNAT family N-acetyltransferase, partial [Myxococcota bacterium]
RLRLRPWTGDDRDPLARLHSDRRVSGPLGGDIDRASSDAFIVRMEQSFERYGFGFWAVEYDRLLIGAIGLAVPRFDAEFTPCVEVGWRLSVEHWGAGFATEGAHAALHYAFDALQLDEVVSFTAKSNVRSQRVMERLGLLRDRDFLHPLLAVDHPLRPHVLYRGRRYSRE